MVRMNILPLLNQRGKTRSWLYKQIGMSCQNFNKTANILGDPVFLNPRAK